MNLFALWCHKYSRQLESTCIFCTNDAMYHTLWHHLSSLSYQFSIIFEDVGGLTAQPPREKWHISSCYLPLQSTAGEISAILQAISHSMATVIKCLPSLPLYILLLLQKLVPKVGTTACLGWGSAYTSGAQFWKGG